MSRLCPTNRIPRALIDPIDSATEALTIIDFTMQDPPGSDTIAILLDHERRGLSIFTVTGTTHPDAMFDVLDIIIDARTEGDLRLGGMILASVRPGSGVEPADVDRWLEASDMTELGGLELVEWFVVGTETACPRDMLGQPPRWGSA
ncbi:MAG: hypothetical protein DRJ50_04260 [Actinobacteria bacterium]|nr:MAG: hypothetical protein DRJ50_04260 [Actinomycetota bacterium]